MQRFAKSAVAGGVIAGLAMAAGPVAAQSVFRPYERVAPPASNPQDVIAADVNGDGREDVVVVTTAGAQPDTANDHRLHVYLQRSDGALAAPVKVAASLHGDFARLAHADMNHDGVQDILVVHGLGVSMMFGTPTAAFPARLTWWGDGSSRSYGGSLVVIDANHDGNLDVLAAARNTDSGGGIWAFLSDGKFGLTAATSALATPGYAFTAPSLGKGDLDHDGVQDLVIAAYGLYVMRHEGASGFAAPATFSSDRPHHAIGDFNDDGRDDVALHDGGTSPHANLLFYFQNAGAAFDYVGYTPLADEFSRPIVVDVDRDGRSDLLATSPYRSVIDYYRQDASGGLEYESSFSIPPKPLYAVTPYAAGDVNGDGRTDIVVADADGLVVLYGRRYQRAGLTVRNDFDGDGRSDLLWRHDASGRGTIWRSALSTAQAPVATSGLDWFVAGTNDFDGDGRSDVLFRNRRTGSNVIWKSGNSATPLAVAAVADQAWTVAGTGDFDADGRADILWRNGRTGANAIWRSASSATPMAVTGVTNLDWTVAAVADFDGDDRTDILWRNGRTGANVIWRSGNAATQAPVTGVTDLAWKVAGTGDFDADGRADVVWRHAATGANVIWKAARYDSPQSLPKTSLAWLLAATGDFDGDGRSDLAWRNTQTGANLLWKSADATTHQVLGGVSDQGWKIAY